MTDRLLLGIDTGGTYTDAVLLREGETPRIIARAKALTTRHDLAIGIAGAVEAVLREAAVLPAQVALVSLSTTLATNALVEGQGGRVGLVMVGFAPEDLARDGLADALGRDPVVFLKGGHDVHGTETPLDLEPLDQAFLQAGCSAFAVAGYFATRNPAHEQRVRDHLIERTGLPVTCSHELASKLGGPRRALTTLLNARLVSLIGRLIGACEGFLLQRGIAAPLMVVRGDGALISAAEAKRRPIETILSGPAASLVGARFLTGLSQAVVSDIGGTTTDVAVLEGGRPRLDEEGAVVGGFRTMVEAVAMRTFGLGGDSEVEIDERGLVARLRLGPRRLLPLSLMATEHPDAVLPVLERQRRAGRTGRLDGRFARLSGHPQPESGDASGLTGQELALLSRLTPVPQPLDALLGVHAQAATLDRLVARGLVQIGGLTPSDALHVLGRQSQWDAEAARFGAALAAARRDGAGRPIAADAEAMSLMIVDQMTRQSAEVILSACLGEDGAGIDPATSRAVDRALTRRPGIVRFALSLDRPLVALGASAPVYYPAIAALLDADAAIPADAGVANAIGAVVGQVRKIVSVTVTMPEDGVFLLMGGGEQTRLGSEAEALERARQQARAAAKAGALASGAVDPVVSLDETIRAPEIEGRRRLVEAVITAVATGRPRIADPA